MDILHLHAYTHINTPQESQPILTILYTLYEASGLSVTIEIILSQRPVFPGCGWKCIGYTLLSGG